MMPKAADAPLPLTGEGSLRDPPLRGLGVRAAHQFDDPAQQQQAATLGMWLFLATEVLLFGALFTGYTVYRFTYPDAFYEACRHYMEVALGSINTVVLLTSSLTMALAVRSAQQDRRRALIAYMACTMLLGIVFLGIK